MKNVFKKITAHCVICNEPVNQKYRRGMKYYCATHYEETSGSEKINNNTQKVRDNNYHKLFGNGN